MNARTPVLALLALAGASLSAGDDFRPLMDVVRATWPGKTHVAVVCDYQASAGEIRALAVASSPGTRISVLDVSRGLHPLALPWVVAHKVRPDFLVVLRGDPVYRDGTPDSTWMVRRLAALGIPSIGTTPEVVAQGAVFAVGAGTGRQLLVNPGIRGTIHVVLPVRDTVRVGASRLPDGEGGGVTVARLDLSTLTGR